MSDDHTQSEDLTDESATPAGRAEGLDFDFAPAEDVLAESPPTRRVLTIPPEIEPESSSIDAVDVLDAELAQKADVLLDMPLPFESVDEAIAAPVSKSAPASSTAGDTGSNATIEPQPVEQTEVRVDESPVPESQAPTTDKKPRVDEPAKAKADKTDGKAPAATEQGNEAINPLVRVLMVVNAPLRLVPAKLRTAVDIVALSLLFWAPVVWGLVLFVFNRSD